MSKTAFIFAGQGAQEIGMGKDLSEQFPLARELFDRANEVLGFDLAQICFAGPEEEITKTENAQPGIYLVSWIALQVLKERAPDLEADTTAGLSLGEFTALAAAGALTFEDGLRLVRARGQFMHEACLATKGGMAAILGLDEKTVLKICDQTGVELANLNCPGQLVISGETERIAQACEAAKANGAIRAKPLAVAGAYHSKLMAGAQAKLQTVLEKIDLRKPAFPVISNVTAEPHGEADQIRARLVEQVTASVRWEQSMRYLIAQGFTRFIELGPGAALSGFLKRIDPSVQRLNVANVASLEATAKALGA